MNISASSSILRSSASTEFSGGSPMWPPLFMRASGTTRRPHPQGPAQRQAPTATCGRRGPERMPEGQRPQAAKPPEQRPEQRPQQRPQQSPKQRPKQSPKQRPKQRP